MRVLIFIMVLPSVVFCYRIDGRLMRFDSRAGIPSGAIILKSGTNILNTAISGDNGIYEIEAAGGGYSLTAQAGGYYGESKNIIVKSDININFYLMPKSTLYLAEVDVEASKLKDTESANIIPRELRDKAPASIFGDPLHTISLMPGVEDLGAGQAMRTWPCWTMLSCRIHTIISSETRSLSTIS